MPTSHRRVALATVATCLTAGAVPALAHQTAYSRGVAVTLHVNPDDEPVAGTPASVIVERVKVPRMGRFSFSSCGCRLRITDSGGRVLLDRRVARRTTFTFPTATAYQLRYSGRYRVGKATRTFRASFAIRAARP